MKLITEANFDDVEYLTEANATGEKEHFIHGIFLQSEIPNRNGRIYTLPVMENAVNRYTKMCIETNRGYGELGHPNGPQINLDRVSHLIVELVKDKFNFIGKAKLTETPMGNIAKGLLKSGSNLGVSSRGMGNLKPNKQGIMEVQDDFQLATAADIVADPSAPNAFVRGIMENVDWIYDPIENTWHEEQLDNIKKNIHKMSITQINEQKLSIFENYLQSLVSKS